MQRRIVITGLGTVNPLGNNVADFWKNIQNGENGADRIPASRVSDVDVFPTKVAAMVKDFEPIAVEKLGKKEMRRMDNFTMYAMVAAMEAMECAGLQKDSLDPSRIGVLTGNGVGGMETFETNVVKRYEQKEAKAMHPLFIPKLISNIAPGMIAIRFNAQGPCYNIATACASGTDAIGAAARWIQSGVTDVMITGGTEAPVTNTGIAGFSVLQALTTNNDDPKQASRPFDKNRDGFLIAEGAGIIILEELEHALKRGATIYGEYAGYGISCDANHLTAPHPEGIGAIAAMKMAVASAGLQLEDIDYINAHGTSTPINDPTETMAIKGVFGEHTKKLKVSSTKSMTGHLLGGAGGVEAIVLALAIRDQFFPATINLNEPDLEKGCDLDYVPHKGYHGTIRAGLSNSLGFGGHNGILCFKKYEA